MRTISEVRGDATNTQIQVETYKEDQNRNTVDMYHSRGVGDTSQLPYQTFYARISNFVGPKRISAPREVKYSGKRQLLITGT